MLKSVLRLGTSEIARIAALLVKYCRHHQLEAIIKIFANMGWRIVYNVLRGEEVEEENSKTIMISTIIRAIDIASKLLPFTLQKNAGCDDGSDYFGDSEATS